MGTLWKSAASWPLCCWTGSQHEVLAERLVITPEVAEGALQRAVLRPPYYNELGALPGAAQEVPRELPVRAELCAKLCIDRSGRALTQICFVVIGAIDAGAQG